MRKVIELQTLLREESNFKKRYPNFVEGDGKIHVLFISPYLNGTGFYRFIAPAHEINRSKTHSAIISEIQMWDFNKQFHEYESNVKDTWRKKLIQWAHYIILPTIFTDISYTLKALYAVNKNLQVVMDIDTNYHAMTKHHPDSKKISIQMKDQLLMNISSINILTGSTIGLLDFYDHLLNRKYPNSVVFMEHIPNQVSQLAYEHVAPQKKNESEKIRIGIIGTTSIAQDVKTIIEALKGIQKKHKEKIEFLLFGWDGVDQNGVDIMQGIDFNSERSVSFLKYFDKLNDLALDIALIPIEDIEFNTLGKSHVKYLELSVYAIPVVASNLEPLNDIIEPNETGYLASSIEEWISCIEQLITDEPLRKRIGRSALRAVWRDNSFTSESLHLYQEILI